MPDQKPIVTDAFGLAPFGEAVNTATKGVVDGAGAFLSRICLPAAEEFGLAVKDRISVWRANNAAKIAQKASTMVSPELLEAGKLHAHPRLVMKAISNGSWSNSDDVQDLWAGLLASSCSETGADESNLIFMNILSQMTTTEVKVVNYSCKYSPKNQGVRGLLFNSQLRITFEHLVQITGISEIHCLDNELDHMRAVGLIAEGSGGINIVSGFAEIGATALAFNLYVRAQGYSGSPADYFTPNSGTEAS